MEISRIFLIGGTSSILLFSLLFSISSSEAHQSFHSEDIISLQPHTIQRSLLQADLNNDETIGDDEDETEDEVEEEEPVIVKGIVDYGVPEKGPRLFYDGSKFLMKLGSPIRVTIFQNENGEGLKTIGKVELSEAANSVTGSKLTEDSYKVNIDWKGQTFGTTEKIYSISIHMEFQKTPEKEFLLHGISIANLKIDESQMIKVPLQAKSKNGFKVSAPLGSSFCCYDAGTFEPHESGNEDNAYKVGLTFPNLQLQVFDLPEKGIKFGPEWDCDTMMPIGVLVGLLVSLFFAFVCFWGFSMLASIQTMDRFDDPRGKTIHVPQTD